MNIILLSGGSGKRLWPLSNDIRSKQFIKIFKKEDGTYESMVQRVYRQIKKVDTDATVTIATGKTQVSAIHNQLGEDVGISVEPCRRDTFPAIALATAYLVDVMHVAPSESVVVCPVDPYVEDGYFEALKELSEQADKCEANLVLMGIEPTYPSEKYGYIIPESTGHVAEVRTFREKPTADVAEQYIAQGALWNGGVFAYKLGYVMDKAHEMMDFTDYQDLFDKYDTMKKISFEPSVAIGYDSRIKSDVFAKVAAGVFAANGVSVNIWPVLMPVPTVSFATRYLHTSAGVMVTASHNPGKYNGYKVYGADGCQITTEAAAEILAEIEKLDIFADVKTSNFEAGVANGSIRYIPDEVYTVFVEQVKSQSVLFGENVNKNVAIVYSPLNGTGLKPVTRTLQEMGYTNITVVKEQEQPDGHFPTCPYPNPEIKEAMALGMEYARKCNADLLLATDPDCDRVGIAVKNKAGEYELLTGNQTGMLLLDYICSQRIKHGKMPADPVMIKTIVTMDMGEQIAAHYGLRTVNVLTGFKFIGEQIGKLEQLGKTDSYVFGFEESYGCLSICCFFYLSNIIRFAASNFFS